MPRCLGASGSVRVRTWIQSACRAPEVQIFCPLITYSSPSRTARVRSDARSEPEPGSEKPWHHIASAEAILGRCSSFCSSVPWIISRGPTICTDCPPSGAPTAVLSSAKISWSKCGAPRPPYSFGQAMVSQPRSLSACSYSRVRWAASVSSPSVSSVVSPLQRLPTNSRTCPRNSCSRSDQPKSIAILLKRPADGFRAHASALAAACEGGAGLRPS